MQLLIKMRDNMRGILIIIVSSSSIKYYRKRNREKEFGRWELKYFVWINWITDKSHVK